MGPVRDVMEGPFFGPGLTVLRRLTGQEVAQVSLDDSAPGARAKEMRLLLGDGSTVVVKAVAADWGPMLQLEVLEAESGGRGCPRHEGEPHNLCPACWEVEPGG